MYPVQYTNIHHDVIDLVTQGMVENIKNWIIWEQNINFLRNNKMTNLCLRWIFLWGYCFVEEVTFKNHQIIISLPYEASSYFGYFK